MLAYRYVLSLRIMAKRWNLYIDIDSSNQSFQNRLSFDGQI